MSILERPTCSSQWPHASLYLSSKTHEHFHLIKQKIYWEPKRKKSQRMISLKRRFEFWIGEIVRWITMESIIPLPSNFEIVSLSLSKKIQYKALDFCIGLTNLYFISFSFFLLIGFKGQSSGQIIIITTEKWGNPHDPMSQMSLSWLKQSSIHAF